jgi:hypothetical protein
MTMATPENIENLLEKIDDAIECAEQLGLTFAVQILDMARLEVEYIKTDSPEFMPKILPFGKRS